MTFSFNFFNCTVFNFVKNTSLSERRRKYICISIHDNASCQSKFANISVWNLLFKWSNPPGYLVIGREVVDNPHSKSIQVFWHSTLENYNVMKIHRLVTSRKRFVVGWNHFDWIFLWRVYLHMSLPFDFDTNDIQLDIQTHTRKSSIDWSLSNVQNLDYCFAWK